MSLFGIGRRQVNHPPSRSPLPARSAKQGEDPRVRSERSRFEAQPRSAGPLQTPLRTEDLPGTVRLENSPQDKQVAARAGHPSAFSDDVYGAMDEVQAQGTGFDDGKTRIIDEGVFNTAVMEKLKAKGYVVAHDGEQLVISKPGKSFNERFDISTWKGEPRKFYAGFVTPPEFAIDLGAMGPPKRAVQTPLRETDLEGTVRLENSPADKQVAARSGHAAAYSDHVFAAMDDVQREGIGFSADGARIVDEAEFNDAVMAKLQAKGFKVAHDGEQLVVGRDGFGFNERYDISTWRGEPRKFYAAWVSPPEWLT